MLSQKIKQIQSGKLSCVENVLSFSKKIATPLSKDMNIFLHLNENALDQAKKIDTRIKKGKDVGKLAGICFALKSNISYKGMTTSCASKVLETYVSAYHATVVQKLLAEDAILLGMVNMDEFACGASGETSACGPTKNPKNKELIPGGSSSGSAAAVAADLCDFALGSDTGGSIRNPASHCGVVGLKPSYGLVSRYGLIDLCMSFDCIGPLTKNVEDAQLILDVIKGQDNFDTTTVNIEQSNVKPKGKIAVVNTKQFAHKNIQEHFEKIVEQVVEKNNWKIEVIDLPLDIALETYYILVYVEFFSGTRKFDGRRFGLPIDTYAGPEVQRRIIGGSGVTKAEFEGKYYREALKARNYISKKFEDLFKEYDAIILPTVPKLPHKIGDSITPEEMYAYDVFTVLANIAKIPAMSVPIGEIEKKPVGIQVMSNRFNEDMLFAIAKDFEQ